MDVGAVEQQENTQWSEGQHEWTEETSQSIDWVGKGKGKGKGEGKGK